MIREMQQDIEEFDQEGIEESSFPYYLNGFANRREERAYVMPYQWWNKSAFPPAKEAIVKNVSDQLLSSL